MAPKTDGKKKLKKGKKKKAIRGTSPAAVARQICEHYCIAVSATNLCTKVRNSAHMKESHLLQINFIEDKQTALNIQEIELNSTAKTASSPAATSAVDSKQIFQNPLSGGHVGPGHFCVTINDAYQSRHSELADTLYTELVPLKEQLMQKTQQMEQQLLNLFNNKQSIDNETKAYFEAIRQRLKTVVGPKTAVLQHSIQEAK
ncbi:MAG: hypothetical protein EZS28_024884, partial [Streblomastix strix]